jgi:hypothetical protein
MIATDTVHVEMVLGPAFTQMLRVCHSTVP